MKRWRTASADPSAAVKLAAGIGVTTTVAEVLQRAGYRTGLFGKWHNGEQYPFTPPGQGFDEFLGFTGGHVNVGSGHSQVHRGTK